MYKQEALDSLECFRSNTAHILGDNDEKVKTIETCMMLVREAEEAERWIPASERMPEENTPVLLGVKFNDDFKYFVTARMDYNYWQGLGRNIRGEIRWMPLPEPYKERREEHD